MGHGDRTGKLAKKGKTATITFDEAARKSFLTGFRKRKNERRQHARQKIAEQVRQEKLEARQEKRELQRQALNLHAREEEPDEAAGSDEEPAGAEVATYAFDDYTATTVVEPLLPESEDEAEGEAEAAEAARPRGGGSGKPSQPAPKKPKKFNLSQPLSVAIPGFKPKVLAGGGGGGKKKPPKKKKAKILSKKQKGKRKGQLER